MKFCRICDESQRNSLRRIFFVFIKVWTNIEQHGHILYFINWHIHLHGLTLTMRAFNSSIIRCMNWLRVLWKKDSASFYLFSWTSKNKKRELDTWVLHKDDIIFPIFLSKNFNINEIKFVVHINHINIFF